MAFGLIADRAQRAPLRDEALTIGHGGWRAAPSPYLRLTMRLNAATGWEAFIETAPIPVFSPVWGDHPVRGDTQTFTKQGTEEGMAEAINMALAATQTWGVHPLLLSLSFGPA